MGKVGVNIASGSVANMITLCEMKFFIFLYLIWDHYLPLGAVYKQYWQVWGGRGQQIANIGQYEGGRLKKNPLSSIQD